MIKHFGIPNKNNYHISNMPADSKYVEMGEESPSCFHICQDNGDGTHSWVFSQDEKDKAEAILASM